MKTRSFGGEGYLHPFLPNSGNSLSQCKIHFPVFASAAILFLCATHFDGGEHFMSATRAINRISLAALAVVLLCGSALGQGNNITANITGGGGSGKCTFEVRVDGVADVQIRGNQGYLQTKQGMRSQWVRLKCNQPLPRNPGNFRFSGVDGRGKQYLLRDPNQNNGVAVIRIEDPRNGMEGYTGDITWNGGGNWNSGNNGGWWQDDWNGGGGWNGGGNNGGGNWNGSGGNPGNWSSNIIPNCQNTIRRKIQQQARGANVNFNGQPSRNQGGSFVMVDGNGNARANNGQGNFNYHCTTHPNGNVADSSFNWTGGNLGMQPR
jgi:hypothetical protein